MKKILVTGAGGFIGSHLAERCFELGYRVKAFVHYNSKNQFGWLETLKCKNEIDIVAGDIRDFDSVYKALQGCDTVFHLAALIGIPYSYVSPLAYIRTNVEGTYNVLESAKLLRIQNIMITSTSETYGTAQYVPIDEKHPLSGQSPYAATKISADSLALSYFLSFDLPVKIVRPFNTYGPRQSARAIIPTVISQILSGSDKILLGNIATGRDLTYITDTVSGFIEIAKSKKLFGEVTNIGMNEEISVENLVSLIGQLVNKKIRIKIDRQRVRPDRSEVLKLRCDNRKILKMTKWRPADNLESGLLKTIDWVKDHLTDYKSGIYNI